MFSIQANFLKEEQEILGEVTRSNIRKVLEKHTGENPELLNSSKGKDIVVFLGKKGAGKSTLINYLSDKELKVDENGNIVLKNPMDSSAMRIGIGGDSETFLPKFIKSNGLLFYDLAGFGDTRGTAISLLNACFIKNIIENAATSRLVFVAGQDEMTAERGKSFKELTMITRGLVANKKIETFSSLVITRSTPGRNKEHLINFLQTKTDPVILEPWIKKGLLVKMSSPFLEEIYLNDKAEILEAIFKTPPQKIKNINIGVIYSDKELNNLQKVYNGEIDDATQRLIKNNFDSNTLSSLNMGTLKNKKIYFQSNFLKNVFLYVDTSPLINLLRPISEKIYHSSCDEMKDNISLTSDKIIGLIDVEIKDQEKKQVEKSLKEEEQRRIQAEAEKQRIQLENARDKELMLEQLRLAEIKSKHIEEEKKQVEKSLKEEEQRRIQAEAEKQRIQLENARNKELMLEQLRLAEIKSKHIEEENNRLQAEYRRFKEVSATDGKILTGIKYRIKTRSTGAVLDDSGGIVGPNNSIISYLGMQNDVYNQWDLQRTWTIVSVNGGYRIKSCNTGAVLDDCGGDVAPNNSIITTVGLQNDVYNEWDIHRTWTIISVNGGYRIKTCNTGAVLDDRGGNVGPNNSIITTVGLQNDVYNEWDIHRTWTFIPL